MASDRNGNALKNSSMTTYFAVFILIIAIGLILPVASFVELSRPHAPPGQSLYLFSKVLAMFVYILMWWQIMMGVLQKVNTKHHVLLGSSVLLLIITHVFLFISAASIRQDELNMSLLLPNFTEGYYKSGLSFGVIALFLILVATFSSIFRSKLQRVWKVGHSLVYITFALATVHGLMIGSDINSGVFPSIIYGTVLSLIIAFTYKKRKYLRYNRYFQP